MKQTTFFLNGSERTLAIARAIEMSDRLTVIITPNNLMNFTLENELKFFSTKTIFVFPDLETLPYDHFSPHRDIISARLSLLGHLSTLKNTIVIASINTLLQRIAPPDYLALYSLSLQKGQLLPLMQFREMLNKSGYRFVSEVFEHGDYAVRGSLIDLYPMGSDYPYRIDLLDDEIDSLRTFDPETQRSIQSVDTIQLLPAHEFPMTPEAIQHFREKWRDRFSGNPMQCDLYQSVSEGRYAAGLEYYLPLFFDQLATLLDYLPKHALLFKIDSLTASANTFWQEIHSRHEQLNYDRERPILSPDEIFMTPDVLLQQIDTFKHIDIKKNSTGENFSTDLSIDYKAAQPLHQLSHFLTAQQTTGKRILLTAETLGHRESLLKLLTTIDIHPVLISSWTAFQTMPAESISLAIASIETGVMQDDYLIIPENQLYGQRVASRQSRQKKKTEQNDLLVRNLAELAIGDPVVHIDHGIGRYLGLQTMTIDQKTDEYLTLEYAEHHKLYVPVSSLHLISRYSGASVEHAPLHHLGNPQWEKTKRKAQEKARDVAAELLALYAQRQTKRGFVFQLPEAEYTAFSESFPFEETPDQKNAIEQVIRDMCSEKTMDRLVCGDVGFGKTEVAMRAAFLATQNHQQTAVLVPTTLLAEQHFETFKDRFANWPVRIEAISRFRSSKEQASILSALKEGKIDIIIGTHKLLQKEVEFQKLGLLIIDEEHRFGVQQKEQIKSLRAEVDILSLTATPIPRTLNMALSTLRDLSIIATPPENRLAIKTFVCEKRNYQIREAVLREILRGGQVYYLHNEVATIHRTAGALAELIPEAKIEIAHGQMREHELEQVMVNF
ncbi:MAG: transcription-repair coupling factor, partial [Gammaproteobacteria bacterium GWF2_41_13]